MALDSDARVRVNKLAAILRVANALDADHLQKVRDVRVLREDEQWVLEVDGGGDLTMERLAALAARRPLDRGLRPQASASAKRARRREEARASGEPELFLNRELLVARVQRPRARGGLRRARTRCSSG